jgi:hypothetical protein
MYDRKSKTYESPDLSKLQEVVVNFRTKIYIPKGADPEEAKLRYFERLGTKPSQT